MDLNVNVRITVDPEAFKGFDALARALCGALNQFNVEPVAMTQPTSGPSAATGLNAEPSVPATPAPAPVTTAPVQNAAPAPQAPVQTAVPTAPAKEYTLEELLAAAGPLMDAGKMTELQALNQQFQVTSMTEIPPERYGELATALRELGARI